MVLCFPKNESEKSERKVEEEPTMNLREKRIVSPILENITEPKKEKRHNLID